uniref:Uncharacterized protein n=1 Tax=Rhinolophus ferrumequinum TaxID=59479 RepID=A0A671F7U9_RHIFE
MTWSPPDGSLISGFHLEESFWPEGHKTPGIIPHIALRGTWTGSPGRWCCWQCRCIPQRLCTGCSSGSGMTLGRGCAPPCARPESAGRERRTRPSLVCDPSHILSPLSANVYHHRNSGVSKTENGIQFMSSSLAYVPRLVWARTTKVPQGDFAWRV